MKNCNICNKDYNILDMNGEILCVDCIEKRLAEYATLQWVSVEDMPDFLMQPYPASDSEWETEFFTLDHCATKAEIKSAQEIWLNEDSEVEYYKPLFLPQEDKKPVTSLPDTELVKAFRDCISYVDIDNLTMQAKEKEWEQALAKYEGKE